MIIWNTSPILLQLGSWGIRGYSFMFALGFLIGQQIISYIWQKEGKSLEDLDRATLHIALGTIIGARLGHALFYNFAYAIRHPLEILLPFSFEPEFKFTGYQGLASHGAAIGISIAIYLYINYAINFRLWPPQFSIKRQQRKGQSYLWFIDRLVIVIALAGCFIRIGNFMNSELFGKPTHSSYGILFAQNVTEQLKTDFSSVIKDVEIASNKTLAPEEHNYQPVLLTLAFKKGFYEETAIRNFLEHHIKHVLVSSPSINPHIAEPKNQPLNYTLSKDQQGAYIAHINTLGIARHPAQLYESFSLFLVFLLLLYRWNAQKDLSRPGKMTGTFLVIVFSLRIFYESLKPGKVVFANQFMTILMPQVLSVPLIIIGLALLLYNFGTSKRSA